MAKTTPMFERSHVRFLLASLLLLLPPAEARGQAAALQDIAPEPVAPYTTNPGSIIRITRWADAPMALLMLYGIEHANRESLVESYRARLIRDLQMYERSLDGEPLPANRRPWQGDARRGASVLAQWEESCIGHPRAMRPPDVPCGFLNRKEPEGSERFWRTLIPTPLEADLGEGLDPKEKVRRLISHLSHGDYTDYVFQLAKVQLETERRGFWRHLSAASRKALGEWGQRLRRDAESGVLHIDPSRAADLDDQARKTPQVYEPFDPTQLTPDQVRKRWLGHPTSRAFDPGAVRASDEGPVPGPQSSGRSGDGRKECAPNDEDELAETTLLATHAINNALALALDYCRDLLATAAVLHQGVEEIGTLRAALQDAYDRHRNLRDTFLSPYGHGQRDSKEIIAMGRDYLATMTPILPDLITRLEHLASRIDVVAFFRPYMAISRWLENSTTALENLRAQRRGEYLGLEPFGSQLAERFRQIERFLNASSDDFHFHVRVRNGDTRVHMGVDWRFDLDWLIERLVQRGNIQLGLTYDIQGDVILIRLVTNGQRLGRGALEELAGLAQFSELPRNSRLVTGLAQFQREMQKDFGGLVEVSDNSWKGFTITVRLFIQKLTEMSQET